MVAPHEFRTKRLLLRRWRSDDRGIAVECWNRGYATEGARAALRSGFEVFQLEEIVSFTVPPNLASRRVMEKIGMRHDEADDFDHPSFPDDHPLKRHVLYRISRPARRELR